jgi:hypothetical protein
MKKVNVNLISLYYHFNRYHGSILRLRNEYGLEAINLVMDAQHAVPVGCQDSELLMIIDDALSIVNPKVDLKEIDTAKYKKRMDDRIEAQKPGEVDKLHAKIKRALKKPKPKKKSS